MEGEGKLNICTRMHPDRSWWVVLHTRSRLIEPFSVSCVPALLSQSHAKGSHAFWPRNQKCTSRWWWIYNRYHVNTLCQVLKTLPKDPCLCSFFPSPIVCTDHLSARDWRWPPMVQGIIVASSQNQDPFRMGEGEESDGNFGSVAHWNFGW